MDALVMAGGKGTRMGLDEKPMLLLGDKPLLSYVLNALSHSRQVSHIYVAVSSSVPRTAAFVKDYPGEGILPVMTTGSGYIEDTAYAINTLGLDGPVLVVSADLPLLTPDIIDQTITAYSQCGKEALSVRVSSVNVPGSHDTILLDSGVPSIPAGINVVHGAHMDRAQDEYILVLNDRCLAMNVNNKKDLAACERLLGTRL
jgi:adenosylcobinamide-phosphate guanylyltransferase